MPSPSQNGELTFFTSDASGNPVSDVFSPDISADARYATWSASAGGLSRVFIRYMETGSGGQVSTGNGHTFLPELSPNARYLTFFSHSTNLGGGALETDNEPDVYLRDLTTGATYQVSNLATGPVYIPYEPDVADNGRTVYAGKFGSSTAVTQVAVADPVTGGHTVISVTSAGRTPMGDSFRPQISDDGRFVTFVSVAPDLVAGDTNGRTDVFRKDLQTGELVRVSTADGVQGNGDSDWADLSADGRYVVFTSSATNLVAGDANGRADVFVKDMQTGEVTLASRDGAGSQFNGDMWQASISADGRFVSFTPTTFTGIQPLYVRDLQAGEFFTYDQRMGPSYAEFSGNLLSFRGDVISPDIPYGGVVADFDAVRDPEAVLWVHSPTFTAPAGLENVLAMGRVAQAITGNGLDNVLTSNDYGSTLNGGGGADTLVAGRSHDVLTGGPGSDVISFKVLPWGAGRVTDFAIGADRLDLSALFSTYGYSGSDPVADEWVSFSSDGGGGTRVFFDSNGPGSGGDYPYLLTTLSGVSPEGLSWATVGAGAGPNPPPPPGEGKVLTWRQHGDTLTGGSGNDTLNASQGPDQLTGGGGGDAFVYAKLPWSAGHATDFTVGADSLDLSGIFQASGYTGADPVADGRMRFDSDGAGGTKVYFDPDAPNSGEWPFLITTLDDVSPNGLTWAQLSGGGSQPPPPPPTGEGKVLTWRQHGDTLTGGSGNDTINGSQGPDQLTGGGGGDNFTWAQLPWNAGHVTDFTPGADKLDLRALFQASGYAGSDPVADGRLEFRGDGSGNTQVYFERDAVGSGDWPFLVTTLDKVQPAQIGAGDWLFR
jgi:Ca2+-binding RTX toxin-like protein